MDSYSSSDESSTSTAVSGITYTCTHCFRKFESGQALGGHQNAHRETNARWLKQCVLENRNHPIVLPAPMNFPACAIEPGLYQQAPLLPTVVIGDWVHHQLQIMDGNESHVKPIAPENPPRGVTKDPFEEWLSYVLPRGPQEEDPEEHGTKDYFREWLPLFSVGKGEGGESSNVHGTVSDAGGRVSGGGEHADEANSEKKEDLNLDLKLGF